MKPAALLLDPSIRVFGHLRCCQSVIRLVTKSAALLFGFGRHGAFKAYSILNSLISLFVSLLAHSAQINPCWAACLALTVRTLGWLPRLVVWLSWFPSFLLVTSLPSLWRKNGNTLFPLFALSLTLISLRLSFFTFFGSNLQVSVVTLRL